MKRVRGGRVKTRTKVIFDCMKPTCADSNANPHRKEESSDSWKSSEQGSSQSSSKKGSSAQSIKTTKGGISKLPSPTVMRQCFKPDVIDELVEIESKIEMQKRKSVKGQPNKIERTSGPPLRREM